VPSAFIPLHEYVHAGPLPISALCEIAPEVNVVSSCENISGNIPNQNGLTNDETLYDNVLSDIRCFQARLADAFDRKRDSLLRDLACEVLARELLMKPANITEIMRRLLEDFREEERITMRVHPDDLVGLSEFDVGTLGRQKLDLQLVGDNGVRRGDAFIELHDGSIDARLGVRLDTVLRNFTHGRDG